MGHFSLSRFLRDMPLGIQMLLVAGVVVLAVASTRLELPIKQPDESTATARATVLTATQPTAATSAGQPTVTLLPTHTPRPTPTLLPPEGGIIYALKPYPDRVGWVVSGQGGNHFGESHLYAGISQGRIYHGAFQFDLSFLPPGSSVYYAAVELTGSNDQRLAQGGTWSVQMLGIDVDPDWAKHGFDEIHGASVFDTLAPSLKSTDLVKGKTYVFVLNAQQRAELERRIFRGVVSFRIDGPPSGIENLFGWDSGYGSESTGKGPVLRLAVALPSTPVTAGADRMPGLGTPTPTYVIITSVPTPANMLTVAADALTATALATTVGTPTPLPPNWVTPVVVTATPPPENEATAAAQAMIATAVAVLTGTPTPTPGNVWTATPTATYVIITPVPTPENELTAVADALTATAWATTTGTSTPLPPNWVTPIVVTTTPMPGNGATATAQAAAETAVAVFTGTPTPTPGNVWTATPTSTPPPTPTPSPSPTSTPTPPPPTPIPVPTLTPAPQQPEPTEKPKPPV